MFCTEQFTPVFDLNSARAAIEGGPDALGDIRLLVAAWRWLIDNPHHFADLPAIYTVAAVYLTASGALRREAEQHLSARAAVTPSEYEAELSAW
jgi:hypothetical protein